MLFLFSGSRCEFNAGKRDRMCTSQEERPYVQRHADKTGPFGAFIAPIRAETRCPGTQTRPQGRLAALSWVWDGRGLH